MNTPAHLIFGLAAFGKVDMPKVTAAALVGAMIPDLSLYLLAGTHLLILGTDPQVVFGQMYFSDAWQGIFRIDNSMILWGIGLGIAIALRSAWAIALCGAALVHLGLDFLLHHDDGRAHFWPISNWIFQSPVSYWDPNHHGRLVGIFEIAVSLMLCAVLWRRFVPTDRPAEYGRWIGLVVTAIGAMSLTAQGLIWIGRYRMRCLVIVLALAEVAPAILFSIMFAGG